MRIHQVNGENKNGPTMAEYRAVPKRTLLGVNGWAFRKAKKMVRAPARSVTINITADW